MDMDTVIAVAVFVGVLVLIVAGLGFILASFYRQVDQGQALIVNTMKAEPVVVFTGKVVFPIIHKAEVMDISVKTVDVHRHGKEGLICKDNIRADIKVTFFVRVNKTTDDVLKVAGAIGCVRASDPKTLEELFSAKFSEALKTVGKRLDFEDLYKERDHFKDQIIEVIGKDLNGYVLEDAAIDYLEQTPLESLDPENILDAQGIRKITELTSSQRVRTNEFENSAKKLIKKQDVEAQEAILSLERQQTDAELKQRREVETIRAREEAEIQKVAAEERLRSETARIKADEEIAIQEQNMQRQIEVAAKGRERVVGVESERVAKDRALEAISRERETELMVIAKQKALEEEKKLITDVVRQRIAVEKTVAQEEESIKDLRMGAEARRHRDQAVTRAEGEAGERLVKELKAAGTAEQVARFKAKERMTLAEAELEAADKVAKAKVRLAEGTQAENAAKGLADVKVKEADAAATEKLGLAQVRVREADAAAIEKRGLAEVRVKEADAVAVEKLGLAEARVMKEKLSSEASGEQLKGLAQVQVREAEAAVIEKTGLAEASSIREKLLAEAAGLTEKAEAMKALDPATRAHEEFRIGLEAQKLVRLEDIRTRGELVKAQAEVLGQALSHARIDIVGGDAQFLDRVTQAVSLGKAVDLVVDRSSTAQKLGGDWLDGSRSFAGDVTEILSRPGLPGDIQSLTLTTLLTRLMEGAEGEQRSKIQKILNQVKGLDLDLDLKSR